MFSLILETQFNMNSPALERANQWLNSNISEEEKKQIQSLLDNSDGTELEDSFYKSLEFGTGGLRGLMGIGSNRMNKYTLGLATQGLSNYLLSTYPNVQIKVAIAYDCRNNSKYFADITADVFSANGIRVFLFEELRPTPQLSYAIRHFECHSGVVITASHNPKEYNGYKAYWNDGAQLTDPHDVNVIAEVNKMQSIDEVSFSRNAELISTIDSSFDDLYIDEIKKVCLSPELISKHSDLSIVFSSIHGTGITLVPKTLQTLGFNNVTVVEEQRETDGNFPTVVYPNPEEKEAMTLALKQASISKADVVMATDPDSDRVGIAVPNNEGEYILLNGNETGSLIIYYVLKRLEELGELPSNGYTVKTIVTSDLICKISKSFGIECKETLTGFKYIATMIRELEGKQKYIAGGEESYGYLISDFVRDKDAITSCAIIAEMTAYAKEQGQSLYQLLEVIHKEFGLYYENLISITKKGKKGAEEITTMMQEYRDNPPVEINGSKVEYLLDYKSSEKKNLLTGNNDLMDFPSSNVLQFITEDGSKISARPSGTEPKIKFYFSVFSDKYDDYKLAKSQLVEKVVSIQKDMNLL